MNSSGPPTRPLQKIIASFLPVLVHLRFDELIVN